MDDFFDCRMDLTFGAGFEGGGNGIIGPFSCFDAPMFFGAESELYKEMGIRVQRGFYFFVERCSSDFSIIRFIIIIWIDSLSLLELNELLSFCFEMIKS